MPDVFISHASKDKDQIARPLAEELRRRGLSVWYDEFSLALGDSLRRMIDKGLTDSRFGVVVLSKDFFAQEWTQRELDGLTSREISGRKVILPIWHGITRDEVAKYSPVLADRLGISSDRGIDRVADEIEQIVNPTLPEELKKDGTVIYAEAQTGRPPTTGPTTKAGRLVWRFLWSQTAPLPVVAIIQWILAIFILHGVNPLLGFQLGGLSPLWLVPLSFFIGRLIPRRRIAASLMGAVVGGSFGGAISYLIFDWASSYGSIFGAFFVGLLASYWSEPTRQVKGLWAVLCTVVLGAMLGIFGDLAYYRDPGGLDYFGTAASVLMWALVAFILKVGGVLARIALTIDHASENHVGRDHDP